jgi:alkylation response protein AidB-like acyl-CoA dehydrogenase
MDFEFSDDQQQLRDACARWVSKSYTFERRRAIVAEGGFSAQAYAELAELGLCALYVPEAQGGMGMGPVEGMVVMEELGRGMVLEPLIQTLMASVVLTQYADPAVQRDWLGGMASGEQLVVLATLERKARYQLDSCQADAQVVGDGWQLSGSKHLVSAGDRAHGYVVSALAQGRLALFLVRADASGVRASAYATQDGSRAADVQFDAAPAKMITPDGLAALEHAVDVGIAALCAQGVGVMEQTLAATVDYMNTRKQFGVAISSFQALRHRVADMKMQLELARSMSYYASLKLGAPHQERRMAMARAKLQLGNAMRFVGQQAVQLHGGIGVTDEYIVSHYFKALTQMEMTFGDSLHQLAEVSSRMQDTAGVFA